MNKLYYYTLRLFYSKEKSLLIVLLYVIQNDLMIKKGDVYMRKPGMCFYIYDVTSDLEKIELLVKLLYDNKPMYLYNDDNTYFFELFKYEPRYNFLRKLIDKIS